ncbi:hypothetical protein Gpo141_00013399 [Globisporangium polare]
MVQSQVAKAKKTWYYADEHQQYPEESTASNDSTGDESSSDPEDDTPLSVRRFYALAFMLPPSPRSSFSDVTDTAELWSSGVSSREKAAPAAVQAASTMDYRKLFTLSVDTPSFYPQVQRAAIASTSQEHDEDDAQLGDWKCRKCGEQPTN